MTVRFDVDGPVAVVTLDRPDVLNAVDPETDRALVDAWHRFASDDALRVAVLRGAGRAFCAGVDVTRLDDFYARRDGARELGIGGITRDLTLDKPVLAAIHGPCFGLGLELALACDLRVAATDALFCLPETKLGIIPGQGGTQRLPRLVGPAVALEMILTAEPVDASRAEDVGLVHEVVGRDGLEDAVDGLARRLAARPPDTVSRALRAVKERM